MYQILDLLSKQELESFNYLKQRFYKELVNGFYVYAKKKEKDNDDKLGETLKINDYLKFSRDHTNKKIILVDIKTTVDVYNFKHSVEEFDYCRQLAYYWLAIHWYFKNELKLNIEEYEYETYIVAVQSHDGYEVRVFKFNSKAIEERLVTIDYAIKRIAWHKNNNLWDHMKEYYDEDGAEIIC